MSFLPHCHCCNSIVFPPSLPHCHRYVAFPTPPPPQDLRFRCRPLFSSNPKRLCCFPFFKSNTTALLSCNSSLPNSYGCALFTYTRPPHFYRCPFSPTTLSTVTLSSTLQHYQHHFCRRPSLPTAQPRLCCLYFFITTTSATFVVMLSSLVHHRHHPHNFLVVLRPHQGTNVIFHRCHYNGVVVLPCSPTYQSYWYVIFPLPPPPPQLYCRLSLFTALPRLSCLSSFTAPSRLCCLLFSTTITTEKLQKTCLRAVNTVTVLAKVLVYFVFSFFTLIHSKMWYSRGHNGRDRLWKNLPYSVHVWLTIRTRRTQEHVAHEGKKPLNIVNLIYSFL